MKSISESPDPSCGGARRTGPIDGVVTVSSAAWSSRVSAAARRRGAGPLLAKRGLDVVCAIVLLLALLPLLLVVAVLIRVSSPGPALFVQWRVGKDGRLFRMYKFRTMVAHSSSTIHESYTRALITGAAQPHGGAYKLTGDPRVTRVGRVLRSLSLDEIPQLVNIARGDMSLVGPRPPLPYEVELYGPRELARLSVTPGLTGLWQVSGRSALNFQQMIELDLAYIEHWSIWLDLRILVQTPFVVATGQGAC